MKMYFDGVLVPWPRKVRIVVDRDGENVNGVVVEVEDGALTLQPTAEGESLRAIRGDGREVSIKSMAALVVSSIRGGSLCFQAGTIGETVESMSDSWHDPNLVSLNCFDIERWLPGFSTGAAFISAQGQADRPIMVGR